MGEKTNKSAESTMKRYEIKDIKGVVAMHAGQVDETTGKPHKGHCQVDNRKVRYLFETSKGALICSSCLKLANPEYYTQKVIDKMYNVAYYDGKGGSTAMSIEDRQAKLSELI